MSYSKITIGPVATKDFKVVHKDNEEGWLKVYLNDCEPLYMLEEELCELSSGVPHIAKLSYITTDCKPVKPFHSTTVKHGSDIISYQDAVSTRAYFTANVMYTFNNVTTSTNESYSKTCRIVSYTSVTPELVDIVV